MLNLSYTGAVLKNNQDKLSILIQEPMGLGVFYRGENEDFTEKGGFKPGFQRCRIAEREHCIRYIQKQTFLCWYTQTPYYKYFISKKFMGGDFALDKEAVAQHYGFATNYLDITLNRKVAEFFAYTYYDKKLGKYLPLEKFKETPPCLYSSFGQELIDPRNTDFIMVGFQVLPRPMWQYACAIDMTNPKMNYNKIFQKTQLPKDVKRARKIYDDFFGGEALFPQDIAGLVQRRIELNSGLNKSLFNEYCKTYNIKSADKNRLKEEIKQQGYYFDNSHFEVSKEQQKQMQDEIDNKIIPWIDAHIEPPSLTYKPV